MSDSETVYTIVRGSTSRANHIMYELHKLVDDVVEDKYWVSVGPEETTCSCPGFSRQKFPKLQHKHIKIVHDFQENGEPEGARYTIHGAGANAVIENITPEENW